jgi:hypothetical protein
MSKVKQSHYRPWQALRFPRGWGSQISRQSAYEGGLGCQPYALAIFAPREIFLVFTSVRGWVDPRAIVRPEGLRQRRIPMTPYGIEPATFGPQQSHKTPYFRRWSANNNRIWKLTVKVFTQILKYNIQICTNKTKPTASRKRDQIRSKIMINNNTINKWSYTFYDRNRFLLNKTNRCTELQFYWYYDSTCFGQPLCPSSGVLSCTSALGHFMQFWWPVAARRTYIWPSIFILLSHFFSPSHVQTNCIWSLWIKPTDALNYNFIGITTLHVSGSPSAHHQEFLAVHRLSYILCSFDEPFATRSRMELVPSYSW